MKSQSAIFGPQKPALGCFTGIGMITLLVALLCVPNRSSVSYKTILQAVCPQDGLLLRYRIISLDELALRGAKNETPRFH